MTLAASLWSEVDEIARETFVRCLHYRNAVW